MGRANRVDVGGQIYHVLNRANSRSRIFHTDKDYLHFENLLLAAKEKFDVSILAYVLMPNHWHLVLSPKQDGDLSKCMQWLTLTHTQQYHAQKKTIGYGHIYQGRYKAFLVEQGNYLLQLIRYVERNPLRARLVKRAEIWRWSSAHQRYMQGPRKNLLSKLPVRLTNDYLEWLNQREDAKVLEEVRLSVNKGKPYGTMQWVGERVKQFNLTLTTRPPGRPKKS